MVPWCAARCGNARAGQQTSPRLRIRWVIFEIADLGGVAELRRYGEPRFLRSVDYSVEVAGGVGISGARFIVSATDLFPYARDMEQIRSSAAQDIPRGLTWSESAGGIDLHNTPAGYDLMGEYAAICEESWRGVDRQSLAHWDFLKDFLILDRQLMVPEFGSPPKSWVDLRNIATSGIAGIAAFGNGGGVPTMLLVWAGGTVVVRFLDPIAIEAGKATAEGVGHAIRRAFGLSATPSLGVGEETVQPALQAPSGREVPGEDSSPED